MRSRVKRYDEKFFRNWEAFIDVLRETFEQQEKVADVHQAKLRQLQYGIAVGALATLLGDLREPGVADQFRSLSHAFLDLADGVPSPLLQVPTTKAGRKKDSTEKWKLRANVVLGIHYLIGAGMNEEAAYRYVIREHGKALASITRPGAELKSSIRTWSESFASEKITNEAALDAYKDGRQRQDLLRRGFTPNILLLIAKGFLRSTANRASGIPKNLIAQLDP